MLLDYSITHAGRTSSGGVASIVLGTAAFATYYYFHGPFGSEQIYLPLLLTLASVAFGVVALIKRRRLWWLGLIGLSMSAVEIGFHIYFRLTFNGFHY